jgi:hypothetical protein
MTPGEEHTAFYHAIGMAITQWAAVEHSLYDVLSACFEDQQSASVGVAFFSVENFRSKLQIVDNVIALRFKDVPHFSDWIELHRRIESAAGDRNALAHQWVLIYPNEKPGHRYSLRPWLPKLRKKAPKRQQKFPPGSLFVRDIALLVGRFSTISNALMNFAARLRGRQEHFPKSAEQEPHPMTLRELKHQTYAILGVPPRSSRK